MRKMAVNVRILALALMVTLAAGQAWSETLRLLTTNVTPQTSPPLPNATCLDLSPAAGVQSVLQFATPAPARIIVRFNAECAVAGAPTNWLNTNIIIDPAGAAPPFVASPSDSDNAFCSGNGTAAIDGYVSALTQAIASVPAGIHTVRVCVAGVPAGVPWWIDDLSLTVESEP